MKVSTKKGFYKIQLLRGYKAGFCDIGNRILRGRSRGQVASKKYTLGKYLNTRYKYLFCRYLLTVPISNTFYPTAISKSYDIRDYF